MTPMSDDTARTTLRYTGDRPVTIGGRQAEAVPALIEPDTVVEVNTGVVESLLASGVFVIEGQAPEGLRGAALNDALRAADLPLTGTADEKRQRLAEHEAATAATTDTPEGNSHG